ncbi:MAG: LysM peptidoglycan-binding domain-containing protein [Pseudomonadota bacterium]
MTTLSIQTKIASLFLAGAAVAGGTVLYQSVGNSGSNVEPATVEETSVDVALAPADQSLPEQITEAPITEETPDGAVEVPPEPLEDNADASETDEVEAVIAPTFDLLRVEPDGSVLIAGQALPEANVEVLTGADVLGQAAAETNGDFVIIIDNELEPGSYELVLRQTRRDGKSATSQQTAIVNIPETETEQVLAIVQQPGEASRLISVPDDNAEEQFVAVDPVDREEQIAAVIPEPSGELDTNGLPRLERANGEAAADDVLPETDSSVSVEDAAPSVRLIAVEIDGDEIFVAGEANPGSRVRIYANEILLGDAVVNPGGNFLVEARRDLPVGDYIIRADIVEPSSGAVLARASVPFQRTEGERLAAVAVSVPRAPTLPETAPTVPFDELATSQGEGATTIPQSLGVLQGPPDIEAAETVTEPNLVPTKESVVIRRGDTLWEISKRVYGRGVKYTTIYAANANNISDPNRIWPGQIFGVPEDSGDDETALTQHRELRKQR